MLDRPAPGIAAGREASRAGARRCSSRARGRRDDGRAGLARRDRAVARRLRRVDIVLLALFAVTLPWSVIGFWNATIGFLIMRFARDPVAAVTPGGAASAATSRSRLDRDPALHPQRAARAGHPQPRADAGGPRGAGVGDRFHVYVLSDTSEPEIAAAEDARFAALAATPGAADRGHLPAAHRQYRLQGRQHPRFLRALGQADTTSRSRSTPTAS